MNPVDVGLVQAVSGNTDEDNPRQYKLDANGAIKRVDARIVSSMFNTCEEPRDLYL